MKLTFDKNYFIIFASLLAIEVLIAAFLTDGFIRHTVGDFLVVILLYCLYKSFFKSNGFAVGIATLIVAYTIEFLQLTDFLSYLGLERSKWAHLILGNYFSVQDLIAYTLGVLVVLTLEKAIQKKRTSDLHLPTSNVQRPTSNVQRLTSNV